MIKKYQNFVFKFLVSLEVFFVLLVLHLVWLTNNDYITIAYGLARTGLEESNLLDHIIHPLIFLGKQIGILIPFFIMSFFLVNKFKFKIEEKNKILDDNNIPLNVTDLKEFLTNILNVYGQATNEYLVKYADLRSKRRVGDLVGL